MNITITDHNTISEIQNEFCKNFPFLKLEFYYLPGGEYNRFEKKRSIDPEKKIGNVRIVHRNSQIIIEPYISVFELEKNFREIYGLSIGVYRKSGNVWLPSTTTDEWSLYEQNKQGEILDFIAD